MNRRAFLAGSAAFALAAPQFVRAAETPAELRIGYQKLSIFLIVKARRQLESRFEPQGTKVRWVEFAYGPPLLEAVSAAAVDYGYTGNAPPVFAQAAHAAIRYVGAVPARFGQAIVVPADSPIKTPADLKGKKIAVAKGSSAQDLLVAAVFAAGLDWSDVTPVYLAPADAASAFARGAVDAWSIWDPFFAVAELKQAARPLPVDPKVAAQNAFFLANAGFAAAHPDLVAAINAEIAAAVQWADAHRDEVAALYAQASGVSLEAQTRAVARSDFHFGPVNDAVIAEQQAVADRFHRIGLIPEPIAVRDIVWTGKAPA